MTEPTFSASSQVGQTPFYAPKNVCFKGFIVTTIVLAAIALVTGLLAVLSFNGIFSSVNSISKLLVIGEVNSYLLSAAGIALFGTSIAAWCCHLRKESQSARASRKNSTLELH